MKITNNTKQLKLVKLRTLKLGDCFLFEDKHYIVGYAEDYDDYNHNIRGDFCLEDSEWSEFTDETRNFLVEKIELKIHCTL